MRTDNPLAIFRSGRSVLAVVFLSAALGAAPVAAVLEAAPPSAATERIIDLEVVVRADAATLYELFTTSPGVSTLFPGVEARIGEAVGDEYLVAFDPADPTGVDNGTAGCRILALEPGRHLSFQWRGPVWAEVMNVEPLPTWVDVDFLPTRWPGATRVRLRHYGYPAPDGGIWDRAFTFFHEGWGSMLERLQSRYEAP